MKLPQSDVDLFFKLVWSLQLFANAELKIAPKVKTLDEYFELRQETKHEIRERIFDQPDLIDQYVTRNPDNFSDDDLNIVRQWKKFIRGDFYIERCLKKYAIFIKDDDVYGVLGLHDGFDEIFPKGYLPVYIRTVLLPFKGQIIYDGLLEGFPILFGGGIKRSLSETYMRAKQNGRIITALEQGSEASERPWAATDENDSQKWINELEQLQLIAKKLKGGSGQPVINTPVFSLVKASIGLANKAVTEPEDLDALLKELRKVQRAARKIENTLYRMD
jgi:hypothetical protein